MLYTTWHVYDSITVKGGSNTMWGMENDGIVALSFIQMIIAIIIIIIVVLTLEGLMIPVSHLNKWKQRRINILVYFVDELK